MASKIILHVYDPKNFNLWFDGISLDTKRPVNGKSVEEWTKSNNAEIGYNGTWFNMPTKANIANGYEYRTVCYMKAKGKEIGWGGIQERLIIDPNNVIGGCYLGIKDNILKFNDTATTNYRCGYGKTKDGRIIVAQSEKVTNKAFCQYVLKMIPKLYNTTTELFIVQDGSHSVASYSDIMEKGWRPGSQRPVANGLFISRKKDNMPKITSTVLKKGSKGNDVILLQTLLGGIVVDGSFGPETVTRVKLFQTYHGMTGDGVVGPATIKALRLN